MRDFGNSYLADDHAPNNSTNLNMRMNKSTISMALAGMVMLAGGVSYGATTLYIESKVGNQMPLYLTGAPAGFTIGPVLYTGLLQGRVGLDPNTLAGGVTWDFFCAELNHSILPFTLYSNYVQNEILTAPFHDGSASPGPNALSDFQQCLLVGVYEYLGVFSGQGFTTIPAEGQDLLGASNSTERGNLEIMTKEKITAAQLVIWEIVHENSDPFAGGGRAYVSLTGVDSKLDWAYSNQAAILPTDQLAIQFNLIADAAYVHCFALVPEITSPVALIAGGLLFMRRREPRALRLTKSGG
jgi:hypothetical protein